MFDKSKACCRYCSHSVLRENLAIYCEEKTKIYQKNTAKEHRKCDKFDFCDVDVVIRQNNVK